MISVIITNREKSDDPRKNTYYLNLNRISRVSHTTAQQLRGSGMPIPEDMVGSVTATHGTSRSRLESDTMGGTREHSDGGSVDSEGRLTDADRAVREALAEFRG